tara:strand:+ start:6138 stop:6734 length:597 start_codon:yes stop_codon:yes gene_type:complete
MIASLTGQLLSKAPTRLIIDNHGIAYELWIPLSTFFHLPEPPSTITLYTYLTLKNDAAQLYGFISPQEKQAFTILLDISGVGPRSALAVLSTLSITELVSAVLDNDIARLSAVPGIGKKSASRLALELTDKVESLVTPDQSSSTPLTFSNNKLLTDAQSALVNLGYKPAEAKKTLQSIKSEHCDLQELINSALKALSK